MTIDRLIPTSGIGVTGTAFAEAIQEELTGLWGNSVIPLADIAGTGDAITATVAPVLPDGLQTGMNFWLEAAADNTGPATIAIERMIREALNANGYTNVRIDTALSPAWSTDWISDEGREKLRAYGIAPPPKGANAASLKNETRAECPRCGSSNTEEISRFGSTPCKALWRCKACAEPFDRFKCH